jgi:hypothetical protein
MSVLVYIYSPSPLELRQEDHELEASVAYIARLFLNKRKKGLEARLKW